VYRTPRRAIAFVTGLLIAIALFGYLLGHSHPAGAPVAHRGATRVATVGNVVLEVPASWQEPSTAPPLAGLPVVQKLLVSPTENYRTAGLIGGILPASEGSPLPAKFLDSLKHLPKVEVVSFPVGQAYRYELVVPGYDGTVVLYAIPGEGVHLTALACYAARADVSFLGDCARVVAGLSLVGQSQYALTPDASYANEINAVIERLDGERLVLRRGMAKAETRAVMSELASRLAAHFATAAQALTAIEPPAAVRGAETVLAASLMRGRDAYRALAVAAESQELIAYESASKQVQAAETGVDDALEGFALLGYAHHHS
jgi:hypothetical protein